MDDQKLLTRIKANDFEALKQLMQRYQDFVYTLVLRIIRHTACAEEATQDVFIKVFQKAGTYDGRAKFSTWLYTIAYRTALNYRDKKKMQSLQTDHELSAFGPEGDQPFIDQLPAVNPDLQTILWQAIDELGQNEATVITLFYLQQFSVAEIAETLAIPRATVKTHLHRGRKNLKKILSKNYTMEDLL